MVKAAGTGPLAGGKATFSLWGSAKVTAPLRASVSSEKQRAITLWCRPHRVVARFRRGKECAGAFCPNLPAGLRGEQ